ncbi:glycosyltransferase family 2 protein [Acinetobacter pseudolwoffii]|uniref:glycosyltransferase family 2 protein n=1 Tax=Acinetobacter pseudolwoffii TaxID=2053287 RepID=UPI00257558A4|nr:glycosyltransferase family 2 protein [Acinetobacter pseudolwoffii]MDM1335776.1 glycosyltransferase family 2 protein [Acinetobacter pseudolwoffii]
MKNLTVFTPSYNRAYCLDKLYKSLCNQKSKDFLWLIVDDGSIDNTRELVKQWISENIVEIHYIYKENGGMHTAHNLAYRNITTEINVCIDSDDYMEDNAVEDIISSWSKVKNNKKIAGMVGLNRDPKGNLIGGKLPTNIEFGKFHLLYHKYGVFGDKKIVLRTNILKNYMLYPEYPEERLVPLSYLYYSLDKEYDFLYVNSIWAVVDYQVDGSSANIIKQYFSSPKGFNFSKYYEYKNTKVFKYKIKALIHFGFTSIILGDYLFFKKSPNKILSIILLPISIFLYFSNKKKLESLK